VLDDPAALEVGHVLRRKLQLTGEKRMELWLKIGSGRIRCDEDRGECGTERSKEKRDADDRSIKV
jgi:hypothetical protein